MDKQGLIIAIAIGLILQLIMVVTGHYNLFVKEKGFAVGGMLLSFVAGLIYYKLAGGSWGAGLGGGAVSGGVCAIIGIAVSVMLADVPPQILIIGTVASTVTGLVGAAVGKIIF